MVVQRICAFSSCSASQRWARRCVYQNQTFSETLLLPPVPPRSRAEATVETAEKSFSHLALELLFSPPACVPHAKKTGRRLHSPSHPKFPKAGGLVAARFPQDPCLVLSLPSCYSCRWKIVFPARRKRKSVWHRRFMIRKVSCLWTVVRKYRRW